MKVGIVGLPNVGKSTLFKALTKNPVDINNYPFCTIEPNVGVVEIADRRLEKLSAMSRSRKTVPAVIEFVDIAGLVKGAAEGEGLGNKFLAHIRETDAVAQVVRAFPAKGVAPAGGQGPASGGEITHIYETINPARDIEIINTELILADLETVNKRIAKLQKEVRGNNKEAVIKLAAAEEIKKNLEKGKLANEVELDAENKVITELIHELSLLTRKPFLYIYNISGDRKDATNRAPAKAGGCINLDIKLEEELSEMSPAEIAELGLTPEINKLAAECRKLLGLITFFTTGEKESRAWTIKKNSAAPKAGAAIHTDFQEKFIRADVIRWDELLKIGSWSKAKETGKIKTVGKDYIVQDGDVIEFKI